MNRKLFDLHHHHLPSDETCYHRRFEVGIDCLATTEILVRGRMSDHRFEVEHEWVVRTPRRDDPTNEILEARARQVTGDPAQFDPELCDAVPRFKGVQIGRGFTSRVCRLLGHAPGNREHLLLAIDLARATQQIMQYPYDPDETTPHVGRPDRTIPSSTLPGNRLPLNSWGRDRELISDLANSCHTYRDESERLFAEREVRCGFDPEESRPLPGAKRIFWRRKALTIEVGKGIADGVTYHCEHHMEDRVHDIRVGFDLMADGTITSARSHGLRLPYHGLCEAPHERTAGLNGIKVTPAFVAQFAGQIGGSSGCTHLFDLAIDCLRLFNFEYSATTNR